MAETTKATLFIVAAPSGGGKTSLVNQLVNSVPQMAVSVSHTTRAPRPGEQEGLSYFFINQDTFLSMVKNQEFIEHAKVFEQYYGTSVAQINTRLEAGIDVVLDIDWQGAQQIKQLFPHAVSIFIIPPSLEVLKQRLQSRKQDPHDVIKQRMLRAQDELSHYVEFDYLIINDDFQQASMELQAIVLANRLKRPRQVKKFAKLLSFLLTSQ